MNAVIYSEYGSPDVLHSAEIEKPIPKENEVLIKIFATTVSSEDTIFRKGDQLMAKLFTGITKPKHSVLGQDYSGVIEAVGKDITKFQIGDEVYGPTADTFGSYAEFISLPENAAIVKKPKNVTHKEIVALCGGFLTALPFLRDTGKIKENQKILINGASGSVGSAAIQIAKYYGATVTAVCSSANIELVKSLGADEVIDYTKEDFTKTNNSFDIIFDAVGKSSYSKCKNILTENGTYLKTTLGFAIVKDFISTVVFSKKKAKISFTGLRSAPLKTKDLIFLNELIEAKKIKPVIDKTYPLSKIPEAHAYVEKGHKKGSVVILVN